jgi:hypothetical protein
LLLSEEVVFGVSPLDNPLMQSPTESFPSRTP